MQVEEKLLALRIRKWQQGSLMADEEAFHPDTDLPAPAQRQYVEPAGHMHTRQQATQSVTGESETSSFRKSPRVKARTADPEAAAPRSPQGKARGDEAAVRATAESEAVGAHLALAPTSPRVKARGDEAAVRATAEAESEAVAHLALAPTSPRVKARAAMEVELSPRAKARAEDSLGEPPRLRQANTSKERFLGTGATPEPGEQYEEEGEGGSLRAHYEQSLDAERVQVEEKLLALRIRKWQHGVRMSEGDP
ncbi:hypothetical protein KUCAC02_036225 [Chaenocephalus aceratus]|nr:hypothetical protein KUCAC02_036225 [Chaenocephalus aceratus]